MSKLMREETRLSNIVGSGYAKFWDFKGRYRVVKGGRGSKKSKTTALSIMYTLMKYPLSNCLVVRQVFNTLKDSCFQELQWAAKVLGIADDWVFNRSPLQAVNSKTGQIILFRGLDDPMGITSLTVKNGVLNLVWIEEAYQLRSEDAFNKIDMSIRGRLPEGYYKQITITFNPWSANHWLKRRFFDAHDPNILAITTNYLCNEFLGPDDIALFEQMKNENPRRYDCEGLGNWGVVSGLVYPNYVVDHFDVKQIEKRTTVRESYGLDFGFVNDPTAFIRILIDSNTREIYVTEEIIYETGLTNWDIFKKIKASGYLNKRIIADTEFKSITEICNWGCYNIIAAKKAPNYKVHAAKQIAQYKIIIDPSCVNFLSEISVYSWLVDRTGEQVEKLPDGHDHALDALIYAMQFSNNLVKPTNFDVKRTLGLR